MMRKTRIAAMMPSTKRGNFVFFPLSVEARKSIAPEGIRTVSAKIFPVRSPITKYEIRTRTRRKIT